MIKVQKQQSTPASMIRPATALELTTYEKNKLASVEEYAQQNKLEVIRVNGNRIPIDSDTKTANIKVGDLAFKSAIAPNDLDSNELFFIRCTLD